MKQNKDGGFDNQLIKQVIKLYPPYDAQRRSRRVRRKAAASACAFSRSSRRVSGFCNLRKSCMTKKPGRSRARWAEVRSTHCKAWRAVIDFVECKAVGIFK